MEFFCTHANIVAMTDAETSAPAPQPGGGEPLLGAAAWLLRPLVGLFVRRGVLLPAVVAMLKQVFVEVATEEIERTGGSPTDSRISLLTGVHRRDVRSLRARGAPATQPPAASRSAAVIARWIGDPDFLGSDGQPLVLPRSAAGDEASFDKLVEGIIKDIRAKTVLDDLLEKGLVQADESGSLTLAASALVPTTDDTAILEFFKANLHDHLAAATANLDAEKPQYFERAVYYSGVGAALVAQLEKQAAREAMTLLEKTNAVVQSSDADASGTQERFRLGVYFYREPLAEPESGERS